MPKKPAVGPTRTVRTAAYFKAQKVGNPKLVNNTEFDTGLLKLEELESAVPQLDYEFQKRFNDTLLENHLIGNDAKIKEVNRMFKNTGGNKDSNIWNLNREFAHRLEFLSRGMNPDSNNIFEIGGGNSGGHDSNLDRLMDFVLLEGQESLENLEMDDFKKRCEKSNWNRYFDPDVIYTYLTTTGGRNRRIKWDQCNSGGGKPRSQGQAGRSGYASNLLIESQRNTKDFGRWNGREFVSWDPINREIFAMFRGCVEVFVKREITKIDQKAFRDKLGNMLPKGKGARRADGDAVLCSKHKDTLVSQFQTTKRQATTPLIGALRATSQEQTKDTQAACQAILENNVQIIHQDWELLISLCTSLTFCVTTNAVHDIIRMLMNSMCMVFSTSDQNGRECYNTSIECYRRLDDSISFADVELTRLINDYGLTDQDYVGSMQVKGSNYKRFHNQAMKDAGLPEYRLQPYCFVFECETTILRFCSAHDLHNTDYRMFLRLRNVLAGIRSGCTGGSVEELQARMEDPHDEFFGTQPLRPLLGHHFVPERRCRWLHRRASLQEMQEDSFPYKNCIFRSNALTASTTLVTDGHTLFKKTPRKEWKAIETGKAGEAGEVGAFGVLEIDSDEEEDDSDEE